jgi:hypothetical protein
MINRLVERYGRTGFAAISSVIWFFPMAAWAGSFDLSPMDKTAYPWIALGIGAVMFVLWLVILRRLGRVPMTERQRRFDISQMTAGERRWSLGCAVFILGLIAWLNAAATVDWGPLGTAIGAGQTGPRVFAIALGVYVVAMIAGITWTARGANRAYKLRIVSSSRPAAAPTPR